MRVDKWWTGRNEHGQANCPTTPHPLILLTISTGTVLMLESGGKRVTEREKHRKKNCVATNLVNNIAECTKSIFRKFFCREV